MAEPRYETAAVQLRRIGHTDSVVCMDCGVFVMDVAVHNRFHSILSSHACRKFDNWSADAPLRAWTHPVTPDENAGMARIDDIDKWLLDLTSGLVRGWPKRYEFRCHPDVFAAIREAADVPPWTPPSGLIEGSPAFGSADVLVQPELGSGCWELYEDGDLLKRGQLS